MNGPPTTTENGQPGEDTAPRPADSPQILGRILPYGPLLAIVALTLAMLGLVAYGADRLALKRQLAGAWSTVESEAARNEVEFFEDDAYRWTVQEGAGAAVIHRGRYRLVGTDRISLSDEQASGGELFSAANSSFTVRVVADQLTLQNERQTLILLRSDG